MKKRKTAGAETALPPKGRKTALGRGLDALIPDIEVLDGTPQDYFLCDIGKIRPNRFQPRIKFDENDLEGLAQSIKEQGILQPLLVRKDHQGYELVTGERRLRAAKRAGLAQVPVIVKAISEAELLEMSIVENVQREDLNPLEEAEAYYQLISTFDLTQDQAADRVGKSRSAVANLLRLRQLPEPIKASISDGALSMGHARALLGAATSAQQNAVWQAILSKHLSVRETENLIKRLKAGVKTPKPAPSSSEDRYFLSLAEDLSRRFGTPVQIKRNGQKRALEIRFYSDDDLDRLLSLLKRI